MGNYSSNEMKVLFCAKIATLICPNKNGKYTMYVLESSRWPKKETHIVDSSYYSGFSGSRYTFNESVHSVAAVIGAFDPRHDSVQDLLDQLECRCNLKQYKTLWDKVSDWASYATGSLATFVLMSIISWINPLNLLQGSTKTESPALTASGTHPTNWLSRWPPEPRPPPPRKPTKPK